LREQIADRLREDVLSGRLAEGERLSEVKLAERFGVSRGPVREALVQLTHEGLLTAKPNCGVRVAPSAPDSIRGLVIPIRRTIETYALRLFFDDISAEDFRTWKSILNSLKHACQQKDVAAIAEQDIAFHRSILERAGQADLLAIWSTIVARVRSHFRQSYSKYKDLIEVHAEHQAIVDTFRTGDKEAAVLALENNIS
jgi:DNA-binding GntR family transcriptional regulator